MLAQASHAVSTAGLTNIDLLKADVTNLPQFPAASFDLILCSAGLLYLPVQQSLREWHRLLTPGGRVAFSTLTDPATPLGTPARCRQALRSPGHAAIAALSPEQRHAYLTELADLRRANENDVLNSDVIYAFGVTGATGPR